MDRPLLRLTTTGARAWLFAERLRMTGPRRVRRQAVDAGQFQAERLDLGQHAVKRGLVGQHAGQDGVATVRPGLQRGKRAAQRLPQAAADTDLIALRRRIAAGTGHVRTAQGKVHPPGGRGAGRGAAIVAVIAAVRGRGGHVPRRGQIAAGGRARP